MGCGRSASTPVSGTSLAADCPCGSQARSNNHNLGFAVWITRDEAAAAKVRLFLRGGLVASGSRQWSLGCSTRKQSAQRSPWFRLCAVGRPISEGRLEPMKKAGFILMVGLLLSATAFAGFYFFGTASCRALMNEPQPGLAWLKKEFKLSDAEFARVTQLHEAYMPQCAE